MNEGRRFFHGLHMETCIKLFIVYSLSQEPAQVLCTVMHLSKQRTRERARILEQRECIEQYRTRGKEMFMQARLDVVSAFVQSFTGFGPKLIRKIIKIHMQIIKSDLRPEF
ncbi:MAG: hypothetical protein GY820_18805 [Gammaproteobacteria bacterium]|nr:hypothetical protein [Gammaproteobacteria bacterium]